MAYNYHLDDSAQKLWRMFQESSAFNLITTANDIGISLIYNGVKFYPIV